MRHPNCKCLVCDKAIYRRPLQLKSGAVFCSQQCRGQHQRTTKACPICQKEFFGLKKYCSRPCSNKSRAGAKYKVGKPYDRAFLGKNLKKKLATKRGGICEKCGENNYAILQIHHKIERHQGGGNEPENLKLLCPNCHYTNHFGYSLFSA